MSPRQAFRLIIFVIAFAFGLRTGVFAETIPVPNRYISIQEAIRAAEVGDTILVGSGVYKLHFGNIVITQKYLTLRSDLGPEETVLEGQRNSPVITIAEDSNAVIEGFTITSLHDEDTETLKGGGIYCASSSSPRIINNIITGNHAIFGGGIYCAPSSSPTISGNVISNNNALQSGGGICSDWAFPKVTRNNLFGNAASNSGGGIYSNRGSIHITNNILWKNTARAGGGIAADRSGCTIINNTITSNSGVHGGGIFFDGGFLKIINVILWQNKDDLYSGRFSTSSRPNHSNIGDGDFRGLNGNISEDPLFVDPEKGDFRLKPDSPCVDAGNPDPIYDDMDGARNDMGAFGGPQGDFGSPQRRP